MKEALALFEAFLGGDEAARLILADLARDNDALSLEKLLRDGQEVHFVCMHDGDPDPQDAPWDGWGEVKKVHSAREAEAMKEGLASRAGSEFVVSDDSHDKKIKNVWRKVDD